MATTPQLTTLRLTLEPLRVDHADEMVHVLAPRELYEFYPDEPSPTLDELRARYSRQVLGRSSDGTQIWHNWIIKLRNAPQLIGFVQATVTDDRAELAWVVGLPWQGQGYAAEAAREVRDACMRGDTGMPITGVHCHIAPDNCRSARVAMALGLQPTDILHDGEVRWENSGGKVS